MSVQLKHSDEKFEFSSFPLVVMADNLTGGANIGSLFRLSDAFNVEKLIFAGSAINVKNSRVKRTARSTIEKVNFAYSEVIFKEITHYKKNNYQILGLEITDSSIELSEANFSEIKGLVLIIGNERNGIHPDILEICDQVMHISMFGKNSSMNVSHATAIALYEITKTLRPFPKK